MSASVAGGEGGVQLPGPLPPWLGLLPEHVEHQGRVRGCAGGAVGDRVLELVLGARVVPELRRRVVATLEQRARTGRAHGHRPRYDSGVGGVLEGCARDHQVALAALVAVELLARRVDGRHLGDLRRGHLPPGVGVARTRSSQSVWTTMQTVSVPSRASCRAARSSSRVVTSRDLAPRPSQIFTKSTLISSPS